MRTARQQISRARSKGFGGLSLRIAITVLASAAFAGCHGDDRSALRIGVTPGPAEDILKSVEPVLARQGVQLRIVQFTDYVQPDMALASRDLDANLYQNLTYLTQFNHDHGSHFVSLGKVYLPPMAIYRGKVKSLSALPQGARIAIPNDPVNHDRALQLLASAGVLGSKNAPPNPHNVQIVEVDAAQLPRSLDDVDLAVINANFAIDAGLNPRTDSLFSEGNDSPFANVLAANEGSRDSRLNALASALASPETGAFITTRFHGAIFPAR